MLVANFTQFTVFQKDQYSFIYSFMKFVVLQIDLVVRVNVYV